MRTVRQTTRSALWAVVLVAISLSAAAWAQEKGSTTQPQRPTPAFDEQADAEAGIAAALDRAKRDEKRVLLMFGANWCGWSAKLAGLFAENKDTAHLLLSEYELVKVDVGRRDKNMDIAGRYGADVTGSGIPFLTVLDADGKVLANQETGALEEGDHHDPAKVQAFLKKWKAQPQDAQKLLKDGLAQAAKQDKRVLLRCEEPGCKWCRRLDEFLTRPDIAEIFGREFVDLKIDVERMTAGEEVEKRFRPTESKGRPWFAVLDAEGRVLATADGPEGNVGFPVEPGEIAHFMDVLKETARRIDADELAKIEQALRDNATRIK